MQRGDKVDALIFELIDERRAEPDSEERDDVLAMLLAARHEDGSPMSQQELRDELMTLLVAGHETTASELAWAFERLARAPHVLRALLDEVDAGDGDDYLTATIHETLRRRPVLPNAAPRLVKQPVEIGGLQLPRGRRAGRRTPTWSTTTRTIYPDPYAFRPERFLDESPGTYTWIPFGGGRRRCLGASFAQLEMKIVLRAVLSRAEPVARTGRHRGQPPPRDHAQPAPQRGHRLARAHAQARSAGRLAAPRPSWRSPRCMMPFVPLARRTPGHAPRNARRGGRRFVGIDGGVLVRLWSCGDRLRRTGHRSS